MNIARLEKILRDFYEISGMEICLIDRKYHTLFACRHPYENFCAYIHRAPKCLEICLQSDTLELGRSAEKEELYTFVCPFGICEAIVPIRIENEVVAYLFAAMGITQGEDNDRFPVASAYRVAPNLNYELLMSSLSKMPHNSAERFSAYASVLPMMAKYIEANGLLSDSEQSIGQLAKNYINHNLSRKITLADISWNLHCSTVTLTEHFKREFGITVMQYVTEKRMKMAEKLLLTNATVIEVALQCGFSDVEYFSRCFKNRHGCSPMSWRKEKNKTV